MLKSIRIEASSICQLRCPSCQRHSESFKATIGNGFLNLDDFKRIIEANPSISLVELSNWGEIFLNPNLSEIIEYAYNNNITLTADNGVNLNSIDDKVLESLVKFRFYSMSCSIDGACNDTYSLYRIKGNFDTVIDNIMKINYFKKIYDSNYPLLTWQFVIFGHNEYELPIARRMANELGMDFKTKLSFDEEISPIKDHQFVRNETGVPITSRREYKEKHGKAYYTFICYQLWDMPQINWDGKLLGCCKNFWGDFGNVFEEGLLRSFTGEKIEYARNMLLGKKLHRGDIPCTHCDIYITMKNNNKWLPKPPGSIRKFLEFSYNLLGIRILREKLRGFFRCSE